MGPSRGRGAALVLGVLTAVLFVGAQAQSEGINVCPTAKWLSLPFLRNHASTTTIVSLVNTATSGGDVMIAAVAYLRTNLVPKIGANVVFFALALFFLVFFLAWRLLRWCCYVLCCRSSCDARRAKHDPFELLFTRRTTVLKVAMFFFALTSVILYIYGMATTSKTVVTEAFDTVASLDTYLRNAVGHINDLTSAVGNVSVVIDDFQAIVANDVNIAGFTTHITVVKTFLTSVVPPATLAASLTALNTKLTTSLSGGLTALGGALTNVGAGSAMATALTGVGGAQAWAGSTTTALTTLNTAIGSLQAAGGTHPGTSAAAVVAFDTALQAVDPGITAGWATALDAISTAVDTLDGMQGAANNPLTIAGTRLTTVTTLVGQLTTADIPALSADITTITSQFGTVAPSLTWLAAQLVSVNATVMELTPDMQSAYDSVAAAQTGLASFFNSSPTPAALAADLSTSTASTLALPASTTTLASGLTSQSAALDAAQFDATPPGSDGATLKAWVAAAKAAITGAVANYNALKSARDAYFAAPSDATYDAMANAATTYSGAAATTTMRNKLAEQATAPCAAANYVAPATAIAAAGAAAASALSPYVSAAATAVGGVPSLAGYATSLGAVALPAATVFDAPQAALDGIQASVMTQGDAVKAQVASTLSSFSGATSTLESQLLGNLDNVQVNIKPIAVRMDGYRYQGSMVLYALPIVVILLLLFCALLVHYHFGVNLSTLLLLVLLVLGFLLGAVIAVVLALLGDVCPAVEPVLLSKVPSNMAPLADYYLGGSGASGGNVTAVLKDAGLVDVDAVLAQVADGKDQVAATLAAYTLRAGPTAVLVRLNATVDAATGAVTALLSAANYDQVFPLYESVKGLLCCVLPDSFSGMWTALTIGGILAWFLVLLTFFFIGKLDALPRTDCCGCSCHTHAKYAGRITPGPMPQPGMGGEPGWVGAPLPPAYPDLEGGQTQAPAEAGWESHVVAEVVVRTPGSTTGPGGAEKKER
ncbi:hypothetical protein Rsub_00048 [Raphidocelis subcapitata]|uniref:Plasma membrane fusion protein PRM1 n=1 Tax=Raphidocelis subcapitata TaxID=307507 RepID=A0A2V0NQX6_9CHLO|nr:hypothetical protein Rsub_00048 [Raphidocelis subcapitata]|eukprot:GBF87337.1 hypothetical protein Rsub_00048 [Raphidocelis subcapitata]